MKEFIVKQEVKSSRELESLQNFLKSNQLPADDLTLDKGLFLLYYNTDEKLIGSGGLEFYNNMALLRSLAVSQELRGQQVGKQIVADLIQLAADNNKKEVYLLTQTAYYFFQKLGFGEIPRDQVPDQIKSSTEFAQVCPASAQVMKLIL